MSLSDDLDSTLLSYAQSLLTRNQSHYRAHAVDVSVTPSTIQSIKLIDQSLRIDQSINQPTHYKYGQWRLCETTLIPLLLTYRTDVLIVRLVVRLIVRLTMPLSNQVERRTDRFIHQQSIKQAINQSDVLKVIAYHLSKNMKKFAAINQSINQSNSQSNQPINQTIKEAREMFEVCLTLVKNLLLIPDPVNRSTNQSINQSIHETFIVNLEHSAILELFSHFCVILNNQSNYLSINLSNNQTNNESTDPIVSAAIDQSINQSKQDVVRFGLIVLECLAAVVKNIDMEAVFASSINQSNNQSNNQIIKRPLKYKNTRGLSSRHSRFHTVILKSSLLSITPASKQSNDQSNDQSVNQSINQRVVTNVFDSERLSNDRLQRKSGRKPTTVLSIDPSINQSSTAVLTGRSTAVINQSIKQSISRFIKKFLKLDAYNSLMSCLIDCLINRTITVDDDYKNWMIVNQSIYQAFRSMNQSNNQPNNQSDDQSIDFSPIQSTLNERCFTLLIDRLMDSMEDKTLIDRLIIASICYRETVHMLAFMDQSNYQSHCQAIDQSIKQSNDQTNNQPVKQSTILSMKLRRTFFAEKRSTDWLVDCMKQHRLIHFLVTCLIDCLFWSMVCLESINQTVDLPVDYLMNQEENEYEAIDPLIDQTINQPFQQKYQRKKIVRRYRTVEVDGVKVKRLIDGSELAQAESINQANKQWLNQSIKQSNNQSDVQSTVSTGDSAVDQSINQILNFIVSAAINKATNPSNNQSIDQSVTQTNDQINEEVEESNFYPTTNEDESVNQSTKESSVDQSNSRTNDQTTDQTIDPTIDQTIESSGLYETRVKNFEFDRFIQSIDQPVIISQLIDCLTDCLINQSTDQTKLRMINQSINLLERIRLNNHLRPVLYQLSILAFCDETLNQSSRSLCQAHFNQYIRTQSINRSINQFNQSKNQSTDQSINQSDEFSTRAIDQNINQSMHPYVKVYVWCSKLVRNFFDDTLSPNPPTTQSVNQSDDQSISPSNDQSTDQPTDQMINQSDDHSINKSTTQANHRAISRLIWMEVLCWKSINHAQSMMNNYEAVESVHEPKKRGRKRLIDGSMEDEFGQANDASWDQLVDSYVNQSNNQTNDQSDNEEIEIDRLIAEAKLARVKQSINQSIEPSTKQAIDQPIKRKKRSAIESINLSINRSINESMSQLNHQEISMIDKLTNGDWSIEDLQSVNQHFSLFSDPSSDQSNNQSTFNQLSALIDHRHTPDQVKQKCVEMGLITPPTPAVVPRIKPVSNPAVKQSITQLQDRSVNRTINHSNNQELSERRRIEMGLDDDESMQQSSSHPIDDSDDESMDQPTEQQNNPSHNHSHNLSDKQSAIDETDRWINQLVKQSNKQEAVDDSVNPVEKHALQTSSEPVDVSDDQTENQSNNLSNQSSVKPSTVAEKPISQAADDHSINRPESSHNQINDQSVTETDQHLVDPDDQQMEQPTIDPAQQAIIAEQTRVMLNKLAAINQTINRTTKHAVEQAKIEAKSARQQQRTERSSSKPVKERSNKPTKQQLQKSINIQQVITRLYDVVADLTRRGFDWLIDCLIDRLIDCSKHRAQDPQCTYIFSPEKWIRQPINQSILQSINQKLDPLSDPNDPASNRSVNLASDRSSDPRLAEAIVRLMESYLLIQTSNSVSISQWHMPLVYDVEMIDRLINCTWRTTMNTRDDMFEELQDDQSIDQLIDRSTFPPREEWFADHTIQQTRKSTNNNLNTQSKKQSHDKPSKSSKKQSDDQSDADDFIDNDDDESVAQSDQSDDEPESASQSSDESEVEENAEPHHTAPQPVTQPIIVPEKREVRQRVTRPDVIESINQSTDQSIVNDADLSSYLLQKRKKLQSTVQSSKPSINRTSSGVRVSTVDPSANQPINPAITPSSNRRLKRMRSQHDSDDESIDQSNDQSIAEPINQSNDQSISRPKKRVIIEDDEDEQLFDQLVDQTVNQADSLMEH